MHAYGVLLALTALVSTTSACYNIPDSDIVGWDIGNTRGDVGSCDSACKANYVCVTWTWSNFNGGTCWLKSRSPQYTGGPVFVPKPGVTATSCIFNSPQVCADYKDIDFVGMDITSKTNKQPYECCNTCSEYSGCTAYAWNADNNGTCWLKKSVGQVEYKPGVISSSLLPLYGGVCPVQYELDYVGNDIGNVPSKDSGICCGQCKANAACKAYTWSNYNGGTCWMKSGKGATVYKAGVTSGTIAVV